MFFGHDLKLQTGFTENSEPVLIIIPFCLALMRLKVFRVVNPVSRNLNEIFIFEIFEFSTDGPSVDHRWPPMGKPSCNLIFPHRWPPVLHRWPLVGYHGLSVPEPIYKFIFFPIEALRNWELSQAAACDGNFYQITLEGDNSNPPPGVLPI